MNLKGPQERMLKRIKEKGFISFRVHQKELGYASTNSISRILNSLLKLKLIKRKEGICPTCHRPHIGYIINK